jgi:hypothetical protein
MNLLEKHDKLISLRQREKELDVTARGHSQSLEDQKQQQKSVERDVLRFQERQRWLERVRVWKYRKFII